jgi:hypothetical protein
MTHALLEGSPAIDKGVAVEGITTDQRGVARPQGGAPDIGSFEFEAPDTTAPSVSCSVSPNRLRNSANNHKLVTVTATVQVTDPGSGPGGFTLVSVTSNQEDSGLGKDDVPNDIQGWTIDDADTSGQLRTERYRGTRTYTLTYEGTDLAGNTQSCQATVTVPMG